MCESGLRTIGISTDGNELFFVPATCQQYQIKPSVLVSFCLLPHLPFRHLQTLKASDNSVLNVDDIRYNPAASH